MEGPKASDHPSRAYFTSRLPIPMKCFPGWVIGGAPAFPMPSQLIANWRNSALSGLMPDRSSKYSLEFVNYKEK